MGTNSHRVTLVLLALLAFCGCGRRRSQVQSWVWPGANRFNTLLFAQSGTRPESALHYTEVWEAEWFDVPPIEPVPAAAHSGHRPLTTDLDRDGRLEIVTSPLGRPPLTILNAQGVPLTGRLPDGTDWARIQRDTVRIAADDSAGWVVLPDSNLSRLGYGRMALRLNQRLVTLEVVREPGPVSLSRMLECRDVGDGRLQWRYEFGARPDLMAVADLDSDGRDDLLLTTYGEEKGAAANGTRDSDSCYCVALRDDGTLLWQRGFGAHQSIGCLAGVAEMDRDDKPDVFVAVYSWRRDFGRLAILDGATGVERATTPDSSPVSYVSAGCADLDDDGRQELATVVCGEKAELLLYRLEGNRLEQKARVNLGTGREPGETGEGRLHAICDLDGDGRRELVVSRCRRRLISRDPVFSPSDYDTCSLLVLGSDLRRRQEIPLAMRCQDVTLGDVIPGGSIELLVVTDRLRLYSSSAD